MANTGPAGTESILQTTGLNSTTFAATLFRDSLLHHRGPDVSTQHVFNINNCITGHMQGCVLHLRGQLTPQPLTDDIGNALLWNGEIFDGVLVDDHENDTQVLFHTLINVSTEEEILKTMQKIHGPWAFIYWQAPAQKLWFGRDMYGRRSLLWHLPAAPDDYFILSSVALGDSVYTEIPSVGIFCLDFSPEGESSPTPLLTLHPWADCRWSGTKLAVQDTDDKTLLKYLYSDMQSCLPIHINTSNYLDSWIPEVNKYLPVVPALSAGLDVIEFNGSVNIIEELLEIRQDIASLASELIQVLQKAVEKRVRNLPSDFKWDKYFYVHQQDSEKDCTQSSLSSTDNDKVLSEEEAAGMDCAVKELNISSNDKLALKSKVAILFSGGLDSTLLAVLADRCVPGEESIDLLNVAFEQPVTKQHSNKKTASKQRKSHNHLKSTKMQVLSSETKESVTCYLCGNSGPVQGLESNVLPYNHGGSHDSKGHAEVSDKAGICGNCRGESSIDATVPDPFNVPDRQTGRIALSELNPNRQWNFVEINVPQAELQSLRQSHIRRLIYPLQTVLDDSIGCAVWFAARGQGVLANSSGQPCISTARVILCGMAADEQFAGYSRHRVTFKTHGCEKLLADIQDEMWRISARNLGRDDRIITDHGKESRFPFLDETFTKFVSTIPIHQRADLRLPRGIGEKLLLRVAAMKLGLLKTAVQPKRAIQFGSKIAKLDSRSEKGSDICDRL